QSGPKSGAEWLVPRTHPRSPPKGQTPSRAAFRIRKLVEAAGVEPASEAVSLRISTSVFRILVLAWRLVLTRSASASRGECPTSGPWRPRSSDPVYVIPVPDPPD